jgi:hypothetical protein
MVDENRSEKLESKLSSPLRLDDDHLLMNGRSSSIRLLSRLTSSPAPSTPPNKLYFRPFSAEVADPSTSSSAKNNPARFRRHRQKSPQQKRPDTEEDRWRGWIPTIGLELHVQLQSTVKLFSGKFSRANRLYYKSLMESFFFAIDSLYNSSALPNTLVAPFDAALPGTLPVRRDRFFGPTYSSHRQSDFGRN